MKATAPENAERGMIPKRLLAKIAMATVKLPKKRGRGVLVRGGLILTAAHCISYKLEGEMALGDVFIEELIPATGQNLRTTPWCVEPVTDVAALGPLDEQSFPKEVDAFEAFCAKIEPVRVHRREPEPFKQFTVYIYAHDGTWVRGTAARYSAEAAIIFVEADQPVKGGASGGPIVNESGDLVGIISVFTDSARHGKVDGPAPFPCLALPVWVCRRILSAQRRDEGSRHA